jgi:hypothetical protein
MVELPEPGAGIVAGLKAAVTPEGRPETESETALLKLPRMVVLMVAVPTLP